MTILITGAAGFIGSSLSEKLLTLNHQVIGIDNFDPFYSKVIKERNLKSALACDNFTFYETDIRDKECLNNIFSKNKIDIVVHLAAKAGVRPSIDNPDEYYDVNVTGTLKLLECMKSNNVKNIVFASSSSVYGNSLKVPFAETDVIDNPISPYAATKKSGELLCYVFHHLYAFNITCLRFFTVYGPRQRPDLAIYKFVNLINQNKPIPMFGDGETARDYTYIDDIIQGVVCAINNIKGYNIYNLGESKVIKLKELIEVIEKALQKRAILNKLPFQPGDVDVTFADIAKAKQKLGYNPKYTIAEGISRFVEWYNINADIEQ